MVDQLNEYLKIFTAKIPHLSEPVGKVFQLREAHSLAWDRSAQCAVNADTSAPAESMHTTHSTHLPGTHKVEEEEFHESSTFFES